MNEEYTGGEEIRLITTKTLREMLACSHNTAVKIGKEAGARLMIGSAVRWRVKDIRDYLDRQQAEVK